VLLSDKPPFQGTELSQLQVTSRFLLATVMAVLSGGVILYLLKDWSSIQLLRLVTVFFFGLVGLLTARTAYMASFINYDYATEFLVYAHAAPGPKQVLAQVEEISRRITGGKDIQVAYDNDALYPYWWYLRDYPNHRWYTDKPTRDLRDFPLIIAGEATMTKMDPIVKDNFVVYNYVRLWWPMQDYFNLTWERVWNAITDARMRRALYDIWMYRDYTLYAEITNNPNLKLETWQPSSRMRFYIRKDIVAQIWNYGAAPAVATAPSQEDPYLSALLSLTPDRMLGGKGNVPGLLDSPRGIAFAPDGTIYVADSRNHRVQHLDTEGNVLHVWGSFADAGSGAAPGGTFNEPWGVAVGRDGSVYVADTWNHRVQKFTSDGQFVRMWGYFGQGEAPEAFWGPRGLAVDSRNRIYVTDTGNKRVVVFDSDGNFVTQWGTPGVEVGQFDEPVGIAIGLDDKVYVADTWNQRVQVFQPDEQGMVFTPVVSWDVYGWFGQSLENKPYITVDLANNSYITDPEGYRVIQFDAQGNFVRGFTNWAGQLDASSLPVGIAFDPQGHLWISDAGNHFLMRFILP
jgi:sugar lactone lactonase YvrE